MSNVASKHFFWIHMFLILEQLENLFTCSTSTSVNVISIIFISENSLEVNNITYWVLHSATFEYKQCERWIFLATCSNLQCGMILPEQEPRERIRPPPSLLQLKYDGPGDLFMNEWTKNRFFNQINFGKLRTSQTFYDSLKKDIWGQISGVVTGISLPSFNRKSGMMVYNVSEHKSH